MTDIIVVDTHRLRCLIDGIRTLLDEIDLKRRTIEKYLDELEKLIERGE